MLADRVRMGSCKESSLYPLPYLYNKGVGEDGWQEGFNDNKLIYNKEPLFLYIKAVNPGEFAWATSEMVNLSNVNFVEYNITYIHDGAVYNRLGSVDVSSLIGEYFVRVNFQSIDFFGSLSTYLYLIVSDNQLGTDSDYIVRSPNLTISSSVKIAEVKINSIKLL